MEHSRLFLFSWVQNSYWIRNIQDPGVRNGDLELEKTKLFENIADISSQKCIVYKYTKIIISIPLKNRIYNKTDKTREPSLQFYWFTSTGMFTNNFQTLKHRKLLNIFDLPVRLYSFTVKLLLKI